MFQPCAYSCGAASLQLPLGRKNYLSLNSNKASVISYACAGGPVQRSSEISAYCLNNIFSCNIFRTTHCWFARLSGGNEYICSYSGEMHRQSKNLLIPEKEENFAIFFFVKLKAQLMLRVDASFVHKSTEISGTLSVLFMIQERRSAILSDDSPAA
uniref:Uncharacterized protein n=1 Tax=Glossina pallidipes TaxID=7398 RepID=A0A1A9ZZ22_GLOPL